MGLRKVKFNLLRKDALQHEVRIRGKLPADRVADLRKQLVVLGEEIYSKVPPGMVVQVCWECAARAAGVKRFQNLIQDSFSILEDYSRQNPFLNSPSELSGRVAERLTRTAVDVHDWGAPPPRPPPRPPPPAAVKEEDDLKFEHIEVVIDDDKAVKAEPAEDFSYLMDDEGAAAGGGEASEDEALAALAARRRVKRERRDRERGLKRKRREQRPAAGEKLARSDDTKERRALQLKHYRKLNNLPAGTVELLQLDEQEMRELRRQDALNPDFLKLKYKCEDCLMGFNTHKLMEDHMASKHRPEGAPAAECDVCRARLLSAANAAVHRRLHLLGYRCAPCDYRTATKHLMMRHVRRHARPALPAGWRCTLCDELFSSKSKLSYHRGVSHQERPQCDCCGKVFANKMTLKYHLKALPYDKLESRPKEKLYLPCKGCSKVFHSRKSYRAHVVIHEGLEYPCPVCGKLFQWKRNLARHIRNHREKDTGTFYECRQCNKRFSSKDCFNNHMKFSKKHVSEESYSHECEHCGKRFATKWCLVDHIDWDHFRKVKYECSHCLKAFKTAKIMTAHVHNIHENRRSGDQLEGTHLCDICGKSYKTEKRLRGHVWAMHTHRSTTKTFKCKLCPATFTWQTSIYKHVKMMHENRDKRKPRVLVRSKRAEGPAGAGGALPPHLQYFHAAEHSLV